MTIPTTITAGDSLSLLIASPDHAAADGWALTLHLVPADGTGTRISVTTAAADPDDPAAFLLPVASTATALWAARAYTWVVQVSRAAERATLGSGQTTVLPDPSAVSTAAIDLRSTAAKALAAIDAYLTDANNLAAASYTIAGRSLARHTRAELITERSKWQAEVLREQAAAGIASGGVDKRRTYVRWGA